MNRSAAVAAFLANAARPHQNGEGYLGLREVGGANRHPLIDRMNRFARSYIGAPWCASSMSYVGAEALGDAWPVPVTADCDVILHWARKRGLLRKKGQPGDLFLVLRPSDRDDARHTGCVEKAQANGVTTLEGNTNNDGSRDGWGYLRRFRSYNPNLVFVRWADLFEEGDTDADEGRPAAQSLWRLLVGARSLPVVIENGRTWVDYTDLMYALYGTEAQKGIGYNADLGGALWRGEPLPSSLSPRLIDGQTFVAVRPAAAWQGAEVVPVAGQPKQIRLARPAAPSAAPAPTPASVSGR